MPGQLRPKTVSQSIFILYGSLGIGIIRSVLEFSHMVLKTSLTFVVLVQFIVFVVMAFFVFMIGKGKDWARITFLVLFLVGFPFSIVPLLKSLSITPVSGILGFLQVILQGFGIILLFIGNSARWFSKS